MFLLISLTYEVWGEATADRERNKQNHHFCFYMMPTHCVPGTVVSPICLLFHLI